MADIVVTASKVGVLTPLTAEILSGTAAADVTAGQSVLIDSNGKVSPTASAAAAPTAKFRGLALYEVKAGQTVEVLVKGVINGFGISGLAYDAQVFLSNTAGALADAAGTVSVAVGRVIPMNDKDKTKVLYISGFSG